jgi:formyltetrahydrofolate deformylase
MRSRLIVSCPDQPGIVAAIAGFLYEGGANILSSAQHSGERFLLRMEFEHDSELAGFEQIAQRFGMDYRFTRADVPKRVGILVSREEHCLLDLLWRRRSGELFCEIEAVISNHEVARADVEAFGVPFVHVPNTPGTRDAAEEAMLGLIAQRVDVVVLARYMQILSPELCDALAGRCINIHHSFLPGFKGANPYRQAHARGVKLIGATAHFVTSDLDEGPIIEQNVVRVDHSRSPSELVAIGQDEESRTLSQAVKWFAERRVLVDGARTIIFR